MAKKRVCVVTGSRADYGLLCWVMKEIARTPGLELIPVVTGAHLLKKFGYTVMEVESDGFRGLIKIPITSGDTSPFGISASMASAVSKFGRFFGKNKVDILVLLGDRFEMLAVALAAMPFNIPIAHIGGGEITEGAIDDNIRYCLTRLSHLHFPITGKCARRIMAIGEEPWRVIVTGSPRLDFARNVRFKTKKELAKKFGIDFNGKVALGVFHPVTLERNSVLRQVREFVGAIEDLGLETVMLYPNLDTSSDVIISEIKRLSNRNKKVKLFKPFERDDYLSILKAVDMVIGNSSISIVEAPAFGIPAVDIGNRQKGRDRLKNVISCACLRREIVKCARRALYDKDFIRPLKGMKNPYGDGKASIRIASTLRKMDMKKFSIIKKNCLG